MTEIIISLTTTSQRITKVHQTILSLLNQKGPNKYSVRLYISFEGYLIDKGIKIIPQKLINFEKKYKNFNIVYTENIGSYRKLIPLLSEKYDEDCLIITVDDDKIYSNNLVKRLVNNYNKTGKQHIIANRAFIKTNPNLIKFLEKQGEINEETKKILFKCRKNKKMAQTISYRLSPEYDIIRKSSFLEGNDGVLYHPKFFTPLIFEWDTCQKIAKQHDDYWFKFCALVNNIGVVCINNFGKRPSHQIDNTHKDGLHQNINKGKYHKDLLSISSWFLEMGYI